MGTERRVNGGKGDLPAVVMSAHLRGVTTQPDLFALRPEGFRYAADFLSAAEESALLHALAQLEFEPFRFRGFEGRRRVASFGLRYDFNGAGLMSAPPIPGWLRPVRDRAAALATVEPEAFAHVLINEYLPGAPIGWHRDRPVFEKVVGVSLGADAVMRFRRRAGSGWERQSIPVAGRSAYLLDGPARRDWEHSLPPALAHRYSITFRNLRGS